MTPSAPWHSASGTSPTPSRPAPCASTATRTPPAASPTCCSRWSPRRHRPPGRLGPRGRSRPPDLRGEETGRGSSACCQPLLLRRLVTSAQDPHPGDTRAVGAVVGLLLDEVLDAGTAHPHPVGDVLALGHPAAGDRTQLQDLVLSPEPVPENDFLGHLPAGGGLPVAAGRQGLEVDRVGQQRAQRSAVLGGQSPRKALTRGNHRISPAVIVAMSRAAVAS